jgi:hypothetical protein
MITVDDVIKSNKDSAKITSEQNEELLKTGKTKATSQSYLPWLFLGLTALVAAIWLWKKGKQDNGAISG